MINMTFILCFALTQQIYWTGCIYKYYQSLEILIPQGHAQMPFPSFSSFPSFPSMGMHRIWRRPPFMQAMHNHPPSSV